MSSDLKATARTLAALGVTSAYWTGWSVFVAGVAQETSLDVSTSGWLGLLGGTLFGIYLAWLASRGRSLGNVALGALILGPAAVAASALAVALAVWGVTGLLLAIGSCGLLAVIAVTVAAPGTGEAFHARRAWLLLPTFPLLALSFHAASGVAIAAGALLLPLSVFAGVRFGKQGLLVAAVGTTLLVHTYFIDARWRLVFWPWGTLAIALAVGAVFRDSVDRGVRRWTQGWVAPLIGASLLQTYVAMTMTDRLSLAADFGLLLHVASFWLGLAAAGDPDRLRRGGAGLVASTLLLWLAASVLPADSGWLGAEGGTWFVGTAANGVGELAWCLLLIALGTAITGSSSDVGEWTRRLWGHPAVLIGLLVLPFASLGLDLGAGGPRIPDSVIPESAAAPERVIVAAFAAGLLRPRDGFAMALFASLAGTGAAAALRLLDGSDAIGGIAPREVDPTAPFLAAAFALLGRRIAQRRAGFLAIGSDRA